MLIFDCDDCLLKLFVKCFADFLFKILYLVIVHNRTVVTLVKNRKWKKTKLNFDETIMIRYSNNKVLKHMSYCRIPNNYNIKAFLYCCLYSWVCCWERIEKVPLAEKCFYIKTVIWTSFCQVTKLFKQFRWNIYWTCDHYDNYFAYILIHLSI